MSSTSTTDDSCSSASSQPEVPVCCLTVVKAASGSRAVGAAVRRKLPRKDMEDRVCWEIELFDFSGDEGESV